MTPTGSGSIVKFGATVDPGRADALSRAPAGVYFDVHTTASHRNGVMRGQLAN